LGLEPLHEALPLPAGAALFALHDAFVPAPAADGSAAGGVGPPPQAAAEPISIPVTADIARVFARFMVSPRAVAPCQGRRSGLVVRRSAPVSVKRGRQPIGVFAVADAFFRRAG
jgi:hypothetical protein